MICARCDHFTLKPASIAPADIKRATDMAAVGMGRCTGFLESIEILVEWNLQECSRPKLARNVAQREKWIADQSERQAGRPE